MQQNETEQFRKKAEQLADTEQNIYNLMQKAGQQINLAVADAGRPNLITVVIPAVLAAGVAAAIAILRDNGIVVIVLVLALLFLLGKVYSSWQNYSMRNDAFHQSGSFARQADTLKKEHAAQINELNRLRDNTDDQRYWWDAGLDPALLPRMPGQRLPKDDEEWTFGVLHELQLDTSQGGIYLHDFLNEPVLYQADRVEALRTGKTAELYRDDAVYGSDATAYVCQHLYACHMMPIEEITSHTTVQKVDRDQVLQDYRAKVDDFERTANLLLNNDYYTNQAEYATGRMSVEDYTSFTTYRTLAEQNFRDKIPDEIRQTQYSQSFRLLWYMEFLSCAMIFTAVDGSHAGQTALILTPTEAQDSIGFTVRTKSETEFCGYLESYVGFEPLEIGATHLRPSLAVFVPTLFGSRYREYLQLKKRDVLAEKPRGLTDEEWVYLIRKDR